MGPEVNWKGWLLAFPNQLPLSARPQILPFDRRQNICRRKSIGRSNRGRRIPAGQQGRRVFAGHRNLPQRLEAPVYPQLKIESASHPATRLHREPDQARRKAW